MFRFSRLRSLLRNWLRRSAVERELDEEIRSYTDLLTEEKSGRGLAPAVARRAAKIEVGGAEQVKQAVREQRAGARLEGVAQDVRYGLRMLRKSPGFTVVAVLTLALGIGANTAIFSVVYAALLRPLPYDHPQRLLVVGESRRQVDISLSQVSYPDFLDWKRQVKTFSSMAGYSPSQALLAGNGGTKVVRVARVSANFFSTLGVSPTLGRNFLPGEDKAGAAHVVLMSNGYWQTHFGGDPRALGKTLALDGNAYTIVGVLPEDFEFAPASAPLWLPLQPTGDMATRRNLRWLSVIGRMAPGVSPRQARAEMDQINERLRAAYPAANGAVKIAVAPLKSRIVGEVRPLLVALLGAVGFVLLIACANIGGLLLARSAGRRREFAIRAALGAGRRTLLRQLLVESLLLAGAGGALGLAWAQSGVEMLVGAIPAAQLRSMPYLASARLNLAVLGFLLAVSVVTAVLFGLIPALQISRGNPHAELKEEARSTTATRHAGRLRDALVIGEIALSLALLVGAGLMLRSMRALVDKSPGFTARHLLTFGIDLPEKQYSDEASALGFERRFTERLRNVPGVEDAASISLLPVIGAGNTIRFVIEGQTTALGREHECLIRTVSPGYFRTMRIPLIAGRYFTRQDDAKASPRVIVSERFVKRYLAGAKTIGRRLRFTYSPKNPYEQVVGVVGDVSASLDADDSAVIYVPLLQSPDPYFDYVVRTRTEAASLVGAVRATLGQIDPGVPLVAPRTMEEIIANSPAVFLRRYPSMLIGSFAALAVLLAGVGLYGLLAYSVAQQRHEIGIRLALGAEPRDLVRMVVGRGAKLAVAGIGLGIVAALALTRLLAGLLYGVSAGDPATFGAAAALLTLVTLAACYVPARRATRIDPMVALRYE